MSCKYYRIYEWIGSLRNGDRIHLAGRLSVQSCGVLGNAQLHVSLPATRYDMETCLPSEPAGWRVCCSGSCQPPECSRTYITGHGKGLRRKWLPLEKKTGEAGCRVRVPLTQIPVPLRIKGKKKKKRKKVVPRLRRRRTAPRAFFSFGAGVFEKASGASSTGLRSIYSHS